MNALTTIADDLTGACEIAAIGYQHGVDSTVSMDLGKTPGEEGLIVYDTETRLDPSFVASAKIRGFSASLKTQRQNRLLFKKIDSVMRGPIASELNTLAELLDYQRVLLVPANPSLGRTVRDGFYRINGVPLNETPFGHDLHHPIQSPWVSDLLGPSSFLPVHRAVATEPMPSRGIVIGDASSEEDLAEWARNMTPKTLPAGSAAFFQTLLEHWGFNPGKTAPPQDLDGKHLLISGTTHSAQQGLLQNFAVNGAATCPRKTSEITRDCSRKWANAVNNALAEAHFAMVYVDTSEPPDPAKSTLVRESLADTCVQSLKSGNVSHVIAEGGATAAYIAMRMNWLHLKVAHVWAPGIVTLRPVSQPNVLFTMKPGSYPWPESFINLLFTVGHKQTIGQKS